MNKDLTNQISKLKQDLSKKNETINKQKATIEDQKEKLAQLSQVNSNEDEAGSLENKRLLILENQELSDRMKIMEEKMTEKMRQVELNIRHMEEQKTYFESQIDDLKDNVKSSSAQKHQEEQDSKDLVGEIEALKTERDNLV